MWTDFRNIVLGRSLSPSPHSIRVSFMKLLGWGTMCLMRRDGVGQKQEWGRRAAGVLWEESRGGAEGKQGWGVRKLEGSSWR